MALGVPGMEADHFLQEHEVRLDRLQSLAQVVQRQPPVELGKPLVDVVGQHMQAVLACAPRLQPLFSCFLRLRVGGLLVV